jgi:hypothetical protein
MTSAVAKYISKRILGETVKNNFGTEVSALHYHHTSSENDLLGVILRVCAATYTLSRIHISSKFQLQG